MTTTTLLDVYCHGSTPSLGQFLNFSFFQFFGFHLIFLGSHLIRDHLEPCDEVPVDDCATLAFVLQKPFTVVSDIVPLAVLLPLQSFFAKAEMVGKCFEN